MLLKHLQIVFGFSEGIGGYKKLTDAGATASVMCSDVELGVWGGEISEQK